MNLWEESTMEIQKYSEAFTDEVVKNATRMLATIADLEETIEVLNAVIAESNNSLLVQGLTESIDELRAEVEFLKQENARLRNHNRVLTTARRQISGKASDLMKQVEEMGQHIMDIAAEEEAPVQQD